jgi:hypothetical protein
LIIAFVKLLIFVPRKLINKSGDSEPEIYGNRTVSVNTGEIRI